MGNNSLIIMEDKTGVGQGEIFSPLKDGIISFQTKGATTNAAGASVIKIQGSNLQSPSMDKQTITPDGTVASGAFRLTLNGETTTSLTYDCTTTNIKSALEALGCVVTATVTGNWGSAFTILFTDCTGLGLITITDDTLKTAGDDAVTLVVTETSSTDWVTVKTFDSLTLGTTPTGAGWQTTVSWRHYRPYVVSISGTGAKVSVYVATE